MADGQSHERPVFLSDQPAGRGECRFAAAVIGGSTLIFLGLAPFANAAAAGAGVYPDLQSALLINDLITAVFLFGQCHFSRSTALILLAGGYLFTALMSIAHALTFPGLFSPRAAWRRPADHGLALHGLARRLSAVRHCLWRYAAGGCRGEAPMAILSRRGSVIALVIGSGLCHLGPDLLPPIMPDDHYTPALIIVVSAVWMLNLVAASMVVCVVGPAGFRSLADRDDVRLGVRFALSAVVNAGRFDLGFYAGRIYGLVAANFVLIMLLIGNSRLYRQLVTLHASDRENPPTASLTIIDALTGIANRRAFDERSMRNGGGCCGMAPRCAC